MNAYEETINFTAGSRVKIFRRKEESFLFEWHYHDVFEITLMLEGQGVRYIGDHQESYKQNDLVLIPPNLPHSWSSQSPENDALVIQFTSDLIHRGGEFSELNKFLNEQCGYSFEMTAELLKSFKELPKLSGMKKVIALMALLEDMSVSAKTKLCTAGYSPTLNPESRILMDKVHAFLTQKKGGFKVAELSEKLNMSESTLRRFIRKNTGRSLIDYSNELRISQACILLIESSLPVSEVALESGFDNLSHFNRLFKKIKKITPRQFRVID